jgi:hypothetical protein
MARDDRPVEQETVRTTIVGGRPPGSGKPLGPIPRGIEVLVKKAAVDPEFKRLLIEQRSAAAKEIGLVLEPAEAMMLAAAPAAQLEAIITQTTVSPSVRSAFLGRAAAVMLAALGVGIATVTAEGQVVPASKTDQPAAKQPDQPVVPPEFTKTRGVQADRPYAEAEANATAAAARNALAAAIQGRIEQQYLQAFSDLASRQGLTDRTVRINLSIDGKGEVESLQIGNPADAGPVGFRDQLSGQIMKWTFPDSHEACKVIVLLATPWRAAGVAAGPPPIAVPIAGAMALPPPRSTLQPSQVVVLPDAPAVTKDEAAAMQAHIVKEYAQAFADVAGRLSLAGRPIRFAVMLDGRGEAAWVRFMDLGMAAAPETLKQLTDLVKNWKFADVKTLGEATVTIETIPGPAPASPEEPKIQVTAGGTIAVAPPLTAKPGPVTVEPGIVPAPFDEKAAVAPPETGNEIERRVRLIAVGSVPAIPAVPVAPPAPPAP